MVVMQKVYKMFNRTSIGHKSQDLFKEIKKGLPRERFLVAKCATIKEDHLLSDWEAKRALSYVDAKTFKHKDGVTIEDLSYATLKEGVVRTIKPKGYHKDALISMSIPQELVSMVLSYNFEDTIKANKGFVSAKSSNSGATNKGMLNLCFSILNNSYKAYKEGKDYLQVSWVWAKNYTKVASNLKGAKSVLVDLGFVLSAKTRFNTKEARSHRLYFSEELKSIFNKGSDLVSVGVWSSSKNSLLKPLKISPKFTPLATKALLTSKTLEDTKELKFVGVEVNKGLNKERALCPPYTLVEGIKCVTPSLESALALESINKTSYTYGSREISERATKALRLKSDLECYQMQLDTFLEFGYLERAREVGIKVKSLREQLETI